MISENKKLKRQSQFLLDKMNTNDIVITDINFEELDEATEATSSGNESQVQHLQTIMEGTSRKKSRHTQIQYPACNFQRGRDSWWVGGWMIVENRKSQIQHLQIIMEGTTRKNLQAHPNPASSI